MVYYFQANLKTLINASIVILFENKDEQAFLVFR